MAFTPSTRFRRHVVFHCPSCFADRVGAMRRGRWAPWPGDHVQRGTYVECTACQAQTSSCDLTRSPIGSSFSTRLIAAARASGAAIVVAGGRTDVSVAAAAEFVTRYTAVRFEPRQLLDDMRDPRLDVRLRGDLMLVAEDLTSSASNELVRGMVDLARSCPDPERGLEVVDECELLLGI